MTSNRLALSLTLASSLLVACGGGGDARSPDRPNLRLDPNTLRLDFPRGKTLPGTGSNMIPVRLLGLQTDQINTNLGPELNVTRGATWTLSGNLGNPAIAELADEIRSAGNLRDVQDIISTVRLMTTDQPVSAIINANYRFMGQDYDVPGNFTIAPPVPLGSPTIEGEGNIAFDPLQPGISYTTEYQQLQALRDIAVKENQTDTVRFCAQDANGNPSSIVSFEAAPYNGSVETTITSPFDLNNNTQSVSVEIYTLDASLTCDQLGKPVDPNDPNGPVHKAIAQKTITLIPAIVTTMEVCSITNPQPNICDPITGALNQAFLPSCKGLDSNGNVITNVTEPAGESVQMVAKLVYTNPNNANQPLLTQYQCSGANRLSWSTQRVGVNGIFDSNGIDPDFGVGNFISQTAYEKIASQNPANKVTATFINTPAQSGAPAQTISADLTLKLNDARVSGLSITPVNHTVLNTVLLNLVGEGIDYNATCTFGTVNAITAPCPAGAVIWSTQDPTLIEITPSTKADINVNSVDGQTAGSTSLTATFSGLTVSGQPLDQTVTVDVVRDPVVSLRLLQVERVSEGAPRNSDNRIEDPFSCMSTTEFDPEDGGAPIAPGIQYHAYALFESEQNVLGRTVQDIEANMKASDPNSGFFNSYVEVTDIQDIRFAAVPGYWSESNNPDRVCYSATVDPTTAAVPVSEPPPEQLPTNQLFTPLYDRVGRDAAEFAGAEKGELTPIGLTRFAMVCVRAYFDSDQDNVFTANSDDVITFEGTTTLVETNGESEPSVCKQSEGPIEEQGRLLEGLPETPPDPLPAELQPIFDLTNMLDDELDIELGQGLILPALYYNSLLIDPPLQQVEPVAEQAGNLDSGSAPSP